MVRPDFSSAGLKGIRRATLLVAELRAAGVSEGEVLQSLMVSDTIDPSTNEPFVWFNGSDAIVFYGLEPQVLAKHELTY